MAKRPFLMILSLAGALELGALGGAVQAQDDAARSGAGVDDQYRCEANWTRCAYFRCPPGRACARTSDWETRDYSRGVDGDAPAHDQFSTGDPAAAPGFDRRYDRSDATGQAYDRRHDQGADAGGYDERYDGRQGEGYDEDGYDRRRDQGGVNDYARNGGYAGTVPGQAGPAETAPPGDDQDQDAAADDAPSYRYQHAPTETQAWQNRRTDWRCTEYGNRCAYFRCDSDGENCRRISGWSSRADADRRPDWDGW